ncbi:MAG: DUF2235 domain-containing protein [Undibacterium sp.]|uniref:T6SS phospholipase effector Tle1-like catalytic domain-containing protein n=1 Tax=Undibacterium sp. TaxID=1914977 RepID=UPI002715E17E|nr:DUF2235 domain-containing protein [Undibacterium sp.]MDO8650696.1 DUF2235 domain-containing protein [Undibacterium sp.]
MPIQDPTFIPNQTDPNAGSVDPIQGGQAAETARRAPGQRLLTAKEREQRQLALGATVPSKQEAMCDCSKVIHFSVFFDGTGNNRDVELAKTDVKEQALSNIYKLWATHKEGGNIIRPYIPGVGTPYPAIGDSGGTLGMAIGSGAEKRIKKAIELLDEEIAKVPAEQKIRLINITVFGFSRGAAQARAFIRDLAALCQADGEAYLYKGKPLRIAFAGLFDTVCSAYGNPLTAALSVSGGHNGWAEGMQIPAMVEQTVHMNSAHELRRRFPLDSTRIDANYPDNTVEIWYPGVHSDVGGGYSPQYQGKENSISRFALNHMFDVAFAAGVLFEKIDNLPKSVRDEFNKDDEKLRAAFNAYVDAVPVKSGAMEVVQASHMGLFHRWLKTRVLSRAELPSTLRLQQARTTAETSVADLKAKRRALMHKYGVAGRDEERMPAQHQDEYEENNKRIKKSKDAADEADDALSNLTKEDHKYLEDIADIKNRAKAGKRLSLRERTLLEAWDNDSPLAEAVAEFFDGFAHDSVAHFQYDSSRLSDWRTIYFGETKYMPS